MKYITFVMVALLMFIPLTLVSARYNHVITDPEGDVTLETYIEQIKDIERPNIDIIRVELAENNSIVTLFLTVKGIITSSQGITYNILYDGHQWNASISFNNGICKMEWAKNLEEELNETYLEFSGIGTDTLSISFSLEEFGKPSYLYISRVNTFEYFLDEFNNFEAYTDSKEPELHEIPLKDGETQLEDKNNESPGFTFLFIVIIFTIIVLIYRTKK